MESRQSRMNKYYNESSQEITSTNSRTNRNKNLYKEVSKLELEDFDLNSNASVIGTNTDNINVEEIKDILSKKYKDGTRKKSFGDTEEISLPKINLDETREYDLNSILSKAKEKKENNYEEERLKKVRNYDILKDLDIINKDDEIEEEDLDQIIEKKETIKAEIGTEKTKEELEDLIDTISAKELIKEEGELIVTGEMDPLDILSDLRGDDDSTKVMGMLVHELEEAEKENNSAFKEDKSIMIPYIDDDSAEEYEEDDEETEETDEIEITQVDLENIDKIKDEEEKVTKVKENKDSKLYDSFIGKTTTFTQSDFDDFDDLKSDMGVTKVIVKILLFIIVVLFIAGVIFILHKQGLF